MKKYLVISFSFLLSVVSLKAQVEIVSAGTGAAYTLNVPGVFPLTNGIQVTFKAHTSCSASATMNVTGTGARSIMKEGNTVPLTGGDIKAGQIVTLAYDGTNWQMLSPIGNSATSSVNGTTNRVIKFTSASTGGDSQITDDGTNVGIGTTTPSTTLEVFQTTNPQIKLKTSAGSGLVLDYNATAVNFLNYDNTPIYFGTSATNQMNIQSNGDVGIGAGVFTPTAKLHVIGGARITNLVGPGTVIADASGNLSVVAGSSVTGTGTTNYLARWTSPTQLGIGATFDNGTSVGIGTPTPGKLAGATKYLTLAGTDLGITNATASLEIVGNTASTNTMASKVDFLGLDPVNVAIPRARIEARSGNGQTLAGQMLFYVNSNGSAANLIERMRIRESGEVGIGNIGVVGSLLSIGASDQFQVSSAGNLIRINNVPYTWPAANAAGFLSNDGAGTLSWSTAGVLAGGTASKVTFWTSANSVSANNSFSWDNTNIRLGVGIAAPDATLNVDGTWDIGTANTVTGATSGAIGSSNTVAGNRALALGNFTSAASLGAMVLGDWSSGAPTILTSSASDQFSARFAGGYRFYTNSTLTATQGIYFSTLGKVGIGVAAPLEAIHAASVDTDVDLETYSTTESSSLHIKRARGTIAVPTLPVSGDYYGGVGFQGWNGTAFQEGARIQGVFDGTPSATSMPGRIEFWTTPVGSNIAVERMRLFNDGNIAIGTTAAGYGLYQAQSLGTNAKIVTISGMTTYTDDAPAVLELRGSSITDGDEIGVVDFIQRSSTNIDYNFARIAAVRENTNATYGSLRFYTRLGAALSEAMQIDENGYVGIGTTTPGYNIHVQKDNAGTLAYFDNNSVTSGTCLSAAITTTATGAGDRYGLSSNAWYGQGLNYGLYAYGFGGTTSYGVYAQAGGGSVNNWAVYSQGNQYSTSGTAWTTSDEKFKGSIEEFTGALDKINKLKIKTYYYNTEKYELMNLPTGKQIGFLAQDLEKVFPEMVMDAELVNDDMRISNPNNDPNYEPKMIDAKVIKTDGLIPVALQAIKEQQVQIEELKRQLEEQKKLLELQKSKIEALEKK